MGSRTATRRTESPAIAEARAEAREVVAVLREQRKRIRAMVGRLRRAARKADTMTSPGGCTYTVEGWAANCFALVVEDLTKAARCLAQEARCDFRAEIIRATGIKVA